MFIIDDLINAYGASQAADAQKEAAQKAMDLQKSMYDQSRSDRMPWLSKGGQTMARLTNQLRAGQFDTPYTAINPADVANDPGYQFRMAEGQKALERSAAARGGLNSGGFMKGLDRYSQGFASNEFQNAWQRNLGDYRARSDENQNRYNRLYNIAAMGENAAAGLGTLGQGYANSMSSLYGAQGNAQAAGDMAWANGASGGIRDLGSLAMMGAGGGLGAAGAGYGINYGGYGAGQGGASNGGYGYNFPTQGYRY